MNPELIKAEIRMKKTTPAAIADELKVNPSAVSHVIHGRAVSAPIAKHIAALLGKSVEVLWPGKYGVVSPLRRSRIKDAPATTARRAA